MLNIVHGPAFLVKDIHSIRTIGFCLHLSPKKVYLVAAITNLCVPATGASIKAQNLVSLGQSSSSLDKRNMPGKSGVDTKVLEENVAYWKERYANKKIEWHIEGVNTTLLKYLDKLTSSSPKKIFIPLCGKTKDIPFLLSKGHRVFGLEALATVIEELNEENSLGLTFDEKSSMYKTNDGRLKIYCGDLMTCPIEDWGPFDCVWDRAAFGALDFPLRKGYMDVMKRAVGVGDTDSEHKFKYLLQTVRYDKNVYSGPPRAVDEDDIHDYFGSWAEVEELDRSVVGEDHPMRKVTGNIPSDIFEITHILSNK